MFLINFYFPFRMVKSSSFGRCLFSVIDSMRIDTGIITLLLVG